MPGLEFFDSAKPILRGGSFRTSAVLPELVRECGDLLLGGRVIARFLAGAVPFLLRLQVSTIGVLLGLPGALTSGGMILLSAMFGAGTMGVCGIAAVLGGYLL